MNPEQLLLGSCLLDGQYVDKAVQAGIRADSFTSDARSVLWRELLAARSSGRLTDSTSLFLALGQECPAEEMFACEAATPTTAHAEKAIEKVGEAYALRQARPALQDIVSQIDDGKPLASVKASLEALESLIRPERAQEHTLPQVVAEARLWAKEQMEGLKGEEKVVVTGLAHFDHDSTPVQMHEYVVLGARTSTGKSSLLTQLAGANLNRGLRVVVFTLETSARAVVLQMASQQSGVNLRLLRTEMPDRQNAFFEKLAQIEKQPLLVFEKDLSLDQIEARCRLLAVSFKPDLVIIDYMGLMRVKAEGAYERLTKLSKAMIPLRKALGCALIVAAQLNRGSEKDDRAPTRTDFRDSGSIEEDAARIWILHRPRVDESGMDQGYGKSIYQQELYQAKHREGPLTSTRLNFFAAHTKFEERR